MNDKQTLTLDVKTFRSLLADQPARSQPSPPYTLNQWCEKWQIARSTFYNLQKRGLAPAVTRIGDLLRITAEADAAWQKAREEAACAKSQAVTEEVA